MENKILGLHHITAIASNAKQNVQFYTNVLGLRLVKKTVNFDDPGTYHFYYGNETGSPGTILTFFPWEGIPKGHTGTGMVSEIGYSVPSGSLAFWKERFEKLKVDHDSISTRFNEPYLLFRDPDGLQLSLIESGQADQREPWLAEGFTADAATRGFHSVSIPLRNTKGTSKVLTEVLGYSEEAKEGNRTRYLVDTIENANRIDLVEDLNGKAGYGAAGTTHHIAFRVKDEATLMEYRKRVEDFGLQITPKIDRNYFFSLYFREPGGVLFEIATDNPGFAVDEPVEQLGTNLKLPSQYESSRKEIERVLPAIS